MREARPKAMAAGTGPTFDVAVEDVLGVEVPEALEDLADVRRCQLLLKRPELLQQGGDAAACEYERPEIQKDSHRVGVWEKICPCWLVQSPGDLDCQFWSGQM